MAAVHYINKDGRTYCGRQWSRFRKGEAPKSTDETDRRKLVVGVRNICRIRERMPDCRSCYKEYCRRYGNPDAAPANYGVW